MINRFPMEPRLQDEARWRRKTSRTLRKKTLHPSHWQKRRNKCRVLGLWEWDDNQNAQQQRLLHKIARSPAWQREFKLRHWQSNYDLIFLSDFRALPSLLPFDFPNQEFLNQVLRGIARRPASFAGQICQRRCWRGVPYELRLICVWNNYVIYRWISYLRLICYFPIFPTSLIQR